MSWAEFFPQECEEKKHVSLFKRPIMMVQTTKSVVQICQFLEVFKMCLRHFPFLILNYNKIKRCLISDKIKKWPLNHFSGFNTSLSVSCPALRPSFSPEQCASHCWADSNVGVLFFQICLFVCIFLSFCLLLLARFKLVFPSF